MYIDIWEKNMKGPYKVNTSQKITLIELFLFVPASRKINVPYCIKMKQATVSNGSKMFTYVELKLFFYYHYICYILSFQIRSYLNFIT